MKYFLALMTLLASFCYAQQPEDFLPATTNVWGAQYSRVDSTGRVELRIKASDATKVRANFWSGPKIDMEKQADGFRTVTTPPQVPGATTPTTTVVRPCSTILIRVAAHVPTGSIAAHSESAQVYVPIDVDA